MKRLALVFGILTIMFVLSCEDKNLYEDGLTYSDFKKNLKADMTYEQIVEKFGQPSTDIGSGIHIYVYDLTDSTEIWIGYTDRIHYARHMDTNQQLLDSII